MTPCPEMSCNGTIRIIETFSHLPQCAGHVAILAVLFAEALLIEIFAPLQKCLGLFPDDSFAHAVAISTHGRGLHSIIPHCFVRRFDVIRTSNLAVRCEVTTGTCQSALFQPLCPWCGFRHVKRFHVGNVKRVWEMADVAGAPFFLGLSCMDGKWVQSGDGMSRG